MHTRWQRTAAFVFCATLIVVACFSMLLIAGRSEHDCVGTNCPVCECILQAERTLERLGTGDAVYAFAFLTFFSVIVAMPLFTLCVPDVSLVNQKVRLNN